AFAHVHELEDIAPHMLLEIRRFFIDYKVLEEKEVEIDPFHGRVRALEVIAQSFKDYAKLRAGQPQNPER
ncbi:MAG: inorganic diphosphatase, partial [Dehalococcoidia bacterium]